MYLNIFDKTDLEKELIEKEKSFKESTGLSDFVSYACGVIAKRIEESPLRYLEYGVYWPSLNALLTKHGKEVSKHEDKRMQEIYNYDSDGLLIVAAERMAEYNRSNLLQGTREFDLTAESDDEDGLVFNLYDEHLEILAQLA